MGLNTPDNLYMRWMDKGKVVRVARKFHYEELVAAFYPTKEENMVEREFVSEIDSNTSREKINRSTINDEILLNLLDGTSLEEITQNYESALKGQHYFCRRGENPDVCKFKTFDIKETEERTN